MAAVQSFFPFDSGAGSSITETQWQRMAKVFSRTGVAAGLVAGDLLVYGDSSGMQVKVRNGAAYVEGFYYDLVGSPDLIMPIASNGSGNPRIDRVALQLDRVGKTIGVVVVQGTPAGSPVAPNLTQTTTLYQMPLAQVAVGNGVATITAGNVTDERWFTGGLLAETQASILVNATSPGDGGGRATHFPGTALPTGWVREATAPTAMAVLNGVLSVQAVVGSPTHYLQPYTPSGAFTVEARVRPVVGSSSVQGSIAAILVRDSGTGDASGNGMLLQADPQSGVNLYSVDSGVYTSRQSFPLPATSLDQWVYLRLQRDGANNWSGYISWDRALWIGVGGTYAKTFTVAKAGFRVAGTYAFVPVSHDYFDVIG